MSTENNPYYLFVYGTLRKDVPVPFKKKIKDDLEFVGVSQIAGELYDIGEYPGAVPAAEGSEAKVRGEVMKINNPEKIFEILDEYEGVGPENSGSEYYRSQEWVRLEDGRELEAWVYWYQQPVTGKRRISHGDYIDYLKTKQPA